MNSLTNAATITVISSGKSYHTLRDWGLAIGNNNYIKEPVQETLYVDIPGMNGFLDMSEVIAGHPVYKYRMLELQVGSLNRRMLWDAAVSNIRNAIDGKVVKIIFDNDLGNYWTGRVTINGFDRVRELGKFIIQIKADPYKMECFSSLEDWEWDSFNFETGVIREYKELVVDSELILSIPGNRKEVIPSFICSAPMELQFDGVTYQLPEGASRVLNVELTEGENILTFVGNGIVSVDYRGGSL